MKATLPLIALLALAPLCPAEESPLQKQLDTISRSSRALANTPETLKKGRAIWEGKQSATIEELAAVSCYADSIFKSCGYPSYLASPDQNIILCYMTTYAQATVQRFGVFFREGDRFVCKNHFDFYSDTKFTPEKTIFEQDGAVLHFALDCYKGPKMQMNFKLHYDIPWDKSYFLPTREDTQRFHDGPTWRFIHAVNQMDTATIAEFMEHGYSLNEHLPDGDEATLFLSVLRWCHDAELVRALPLLLQNCGADIHTRDSEGWGVLHTTQFLTRKPNAIKVLLDAGADPNTADSTGTTPLMLAAARFEPTTVKHLLAAGADVNALDHEGRTAMHDLLFPWFAVGWPHECGPEDTRDKVDEATREICEKMLETARLLLAAGADINATDKEGRTPIFMVLRDYNEIPEEGMLILLPELVKMGADLTHKDASGKTLAEQLPDWRKMARKLINDLLAKK